MPFQLGHIPYYSWKARECPIDETVYPPVVKGEN